MIKKHQMNMRVSNLAARQILKLQKRLNMSKTELVTLAIDRLYREEIGKIERKIDRTR